MKFIVKSAGNEFSDYELIINYIEELQELSVKYGKELIINFDTWTITIHDYYME